LAAVRGENNRAILLEGDRGLLLVHHLQLRAHGVEHDSAKLLGGLDGELEVLQRLLVVRGVPPREIEPRDGHAGLEAGGDGVDGAGLGSKRADDLGHRREEARLGGLEDGRHPDGLLEEEIGGMHPDGGGGGRRIFPLFFLCCKEKEAEAEAAVEANGGVRSSSATLGSLG